MGTRIWIGMLVVGAALGAVYLSSTPGSGAGTPQSGVAISPTTLDFGRLALGDHRTELIVATNFSERRVRIERIEASGPYRLSRHALDLAPGEAREIEVDFRPRETGAQGGHVRLVAEAFDGGDQLVPLHGVVHQPPAIRVDPLLIHFGEVAVDGFAEARLRIENAGDAPLALPVLEIDAPFEIASAETWLAPGARLELPVRFRPSDVGPHAKRLVVRSNDPKMARVSVGLDGEGVSRSPLVEAELVPGQLDFGDVKVGESRERWLHVRNSGAHPLQVTSVAIDPPFMASLNKRRVYPGRFAILPVRYAPTREGEHASAIRVYTNDPKRSVLEVALRGQGAAEGDGAPAVGTLSAVRAYWDGGELPEVGAEAGLEGDELGAAVAPRGADGVIAIASYTSRIDEWSVDGVAFDRASGRLVVESVQLPDVDAALGEYFVFDETKLVASVRPDGSASATLDLVMRDGYGGETALQVPLTTGEHIVAQNGQPTVLEGRPLQDDSIQLVGAVAPASGALRGHAVRLLLEFAIPSEEAER